MVIIDCFAARICFANKQPSGLGANQAEVDLDHTGWEKYKITESSLCLLAPWRPLTFPLGLEEESVTRHYVWTFSNTGKVVIFCDSVQWRRRTQQYELHFSFSMAIFFRYMSSLDINAVPTVCHSQTTGQTYSARNTLPFWCRESWVILIPCFHTMSIRLHGEFCHYLYPWGKLHNLLGSLFSYWQNGKSDSGKSAI